MSLYALNSGGRFVLTAAGDIQTTDRAQQAVKKVGPRDNDAAYCCSVYFKAMSQFPLCAASGQVCKEQEELIYRQQFLRVGEK